VAENHLFYDTHIGIISPNSAITTHQTRPSADFVSLLNFGWMITDIFVWTYSKRWKFS